ncbi:MAG: substrate-binding domain-containing protein [Methylococcales bacterium]|nr:substrate-binding domain-containing protein [Methylococcales bacterium]
MKYTFLVFILFYASLLKAVDTPDKIIAFAQDDMSNDFRKAQVFDVRDHLLKYPAIQFTYSDAQGQTSLLIKQIEQFIQQKVDVLVIGTNDENAVVPVVTQAYQAGIPTIILDRGINSENYTSFINTNNMQIGVIAAQYLAKQLKGKGTVLLFEGLPHADVTKLRTKGFLKTIKKYKNISVITRTGNFLRRDALLEMEKIIQQGIHIDAIFAESDSMLSGVRMVLDKHNIAADSLIMIGCDYTLEAQQAIRKGQQSASIFFPLGGKETVATALQILANKIVPKHIITNPVKLVTKNNVNKIKAIF